MKKFNNIFNETLYKIEPEDLPKIKFPGMSKKNKKNISKYANDYFENPSVKIKRRGFSAKKLAAVMCAAVLLITSSIFIYANGEMIVSEIVKILTREEKLIDPKAVVIDLSDEHDGITLTVDKIARDGEQILIYYTIRNQSGAFNSAHDNSRCFLNYDEMTLTKWDKAGVRQDTALTERGNIYTGTIIGEISKDADAVTSMIYFNIRENYSGTYRLSFDKLYMQDDMDERIYLSGETLWVEFKIPDEIESVDYELIDIDKSFNINGVNVYIEHLKVSPLTVKMFMKFDEDGSDPGILYYKMFENDDADSMMKFLFDIKFTEESGLQRENTEMRLIYLENGVQVTFRANFPMYPDEIERIWAYGLRENDNFDEITIYQK